jgi:hypothetical protein
MRLKAEIAVAVCTGAVSVLLAWWMLGVSVSDIGKPWINGDGLVIYSFAKAMAENGWYSPNPRLGFPNPQDFYLLPNGDLRFLLELKAMTLISKNPFTAVNIMNLLGFALIGTTAYALMRLIRASVWVAVPLAVSLSLLPWHFTRFIGHLFLADYSSVLVGLFAIVLIRRWAAEPESMSVRRLALRCAGIGAMSLYVGWSGFYYAFMLIVIAAAVLARPVLARLSLGSFLPAATFVVLVPVALFGWLRIQKLAAIWTVNPEIYSRQYLESEIYGGSIASLFLPSPNSGIASLAAWRADYDSLSTFEWESMADNSLIGIIAVVFAFLLVGLSLAPVGMRTRGNALSQRVAQIFASTRETLVLAAADCRDAGLSLGFIITVLFFATGGLGALFAFVVSNQIRAWGRFSIFVIIISVCILSILLTHLATSWRGRPALIAVGVVLSLIVLGEQVSGAYHRPVGDMNAYREEAQAFMAQVEATTPAKCGVLSLPVHEFPESPPVGAMIDYDQLWPYLTSSNLRFTYGVIKKSPQSAFQDQFADAITVDSIATLRANGICGVLIDTFAYPDRGTALIQQIRPLTGIDPVYSGAGRWAYLPAS